MARNKKQNKSSSSITPLKYKYKQIFFYHVNSNLHGHHAGKKQ